MMYRSVLLALALMLGLLTTTMASAHIVGLGYTFVGDDIHFDALHWHDNHAAAGALTVNGVSHDFSSYTWDTTEMTGLDGGLVNSDYSAYDENSGTLSATGASTSHGGDGIVNDWLHVIVPNPGTESISLSTFYGPGGLTSWTLDDQITQFDLSQPDPDEGGAAATVPEPATLGLMGLGMLTLLVGGKGRRNSLAD